jgi:hypothetical protein
VTYVNLLFMTGALLNVRATRKSKEKQKVTGEPGTVRRSPVGG